MQIESKHVIVARFKRAWVFTKEEPTYRVCGEVVVTPNYVFARGHGCDDIDYEIISGLCILREDIHSIEDMSHRTCDIHDEIAADDAEETTSDK